MTGLDQLPTELLDRILDSLSSSDSPTRQNDLASLCLTSKRFCHLATRSLYDRPILKDAKRISQYLRTHLGWINPWSRLKGEKRKVVKPRSISFDYRSPGGGKPCKVPSLSLYIELGYFDNLTSLHFLNYHDKEHLLPRLLAPHSPLRSQLRQLSIVPERPQVIDNLTLAFLLEPSIYAELDMFTSLKLVSSFEVVPNCKTWVDVEDRDPIFNPMLESSWVRAPETLKVRAHTDFDVFTSTFDYQFSDQPDYKPPFPDEWPISPSILTSPFTSLTSLSIAIGTSFNLVVLFGGPTFANLKELDLSGIDQYQKPIEIENDDITLIRRSYSTVKRKLHPSLSSVCRGPSRIDFDSSAWISPGNKTCFSKRPKRSDPGESKFHWPELNDIDFEAFREYRGPRLEWLDLRELYLKVI